MPQSVVIPVILSGGTGARLWPVSRETHPKPFITLPDGQSLLQKTFSRACQLPHIAQIITLTNKEYYLKSLAEYEKSFQYKELPRQFLLEPFARNTAPAIALAALKACEINDEAILFILPADHLIPDEIAFLHAAKKAILAATQNQLVTLGIRPTRPETGFGYLERSSDTQKVARFIEKPDLTTATQFLTDPRFLWNAGMFCFKANVILDQLAYHAADVLQGAKRCFENSKSSSKTVCELSETDFAALPNISIDYAVMEKSKDIAVIPCDFAWHDVGSWEAYKQLFDSDTRGNTIVGDAILIDSANNFIYSENRMTASIGINNLAIIDTPDALLITHRDRTQDVKHVVQALKNNAHESYLTHRTVFRPWGSYTVLEEHVGFKIKRIIVKPQASLSLQQHQHRSEHWIVVEGTATVVIGDTTHILQKNESTFVPMQTPHRLSNTTDKELIIIEVQTGSYLGEDDIIRLEDTYGRVT